MKKIGLLHTVPTVYGTFAGRLREAMPGEELLIHNTVDEFLASDANVNGFTQTNLNRLFNLLKAVELEGTDIIAVTCSTLTPWVKKIRQFISIPIVCIDDAMTAKAVEIGSRITVLATAYSTIEPTCGKLREDAEKIGRTLEINDIVCDAAYTAIKRLDQKAHDDELKKAAEQISGRDVIVLAQASMAHLEQDIQKLTGIPTLSSPNLCVQQIREMLLGK